MTVGGSDSERRVWAAMPAGSQEALTRDLSSSDLQTLQLAVARARAEAVQPADLLRRWRTDRFVRPSGSDPRTVAVIEADLWQRLPADFAGVELSPVVPVGTCSAVAPVSQNRVVTTARSAEVLSDPTNALALEAAVRRLADPDRDVHLAACHRVLRAQDFGVGWSSHFRLFALVSSARDAGSATTEATMLVRHLNYWQSVLGSLLDGDRVELSVSDFDNATLRERIYDTVIPATVGSAVRVTHDSERTRARGYYSSGALLITARCDDGTHVELGDGGFTDWTAQLTSNAKERCLVSCIATERLTELARVPK